MPTLIKPEDKAVVQSNGRTGSQDTDRHAGPGPWKLIAGIVIIAAITVTVITRWRGTAPLPVGLIQVNGRMEGDLVSISSKYAGRIGTLLVREGDQVTQGQILVKLDDSELRSRLHQAEAAAKTAEAQAGGASHSVDLTTDTTGAQVVQAQGVLNQSESAVEAARADLLRSGAFISSARATARAADAGILAARASVDSAIVGKAHAEAALRSAESELESARANTRVAESAAEAAKTFSEKSDRDARRYAALLKEGAISSQTEDQAATAARNARAQWDGALRQIDAAKATENARQSAVEAARQQVQSAESGIRQARAQLSVARGQSSAAWASVRQAEALEQASRQSVKQAEARRLQAVGQMKQAHTAPSQIAVTKAAHDQALSRIDEAKAGVRELRSTLDAMSIAAPVSGTVTTRFRDQGEVVTAGTPLLDVVDLDRLYLKVYVPETEIGHVRLGLPARIYVDTFPNTHFDATVTYIASTAEFTPKEVQTPDERVKLVYAVKLTLKANSNHQLTPGMPADAIIQWKPEVTWEKPRW